MLHAVPLIKKYTCRFTTPLNIKDVTIIIIIIKIKIIIIMHHKNKTKDKRKVAVTVTERCASLRPRAGK